MDRFDAAVDRLNFALAQFLAHSGNPEIALAWLEAFWAWDEYKRNTNQEEIHLCR